MTRRPQSGLHVYVYRHAIMREEAALSMDAILGREHVFAHRGQKAFARSDLIEPRRERFIIEMGRRLRPFAGALNQKEVRIASNGADILTLSSVAGIRKPPCAVEIDAINDGEPDSCSARRDMIVKPRHLLSTQGFSARHVKSNVRFIPAMHHTRLNVTTLSVAYMDPRFRRMTVECGS